MISIHAPLAGCDEVAVDGRLIAEISIHAPLAGCDTSASARVTSMGISIHAPLAGCDRQRRERRRETPYFNPRTPCGVRLVIIGDCVTLTGFQSTHPLRGATTDKSVTIQTGDISIHAPLAGCDGSFVFPSPVHHRFQSTHPLRGATRRKKTFRRQAPNFNPRTPCGVRHGGLLCRFPRRDFNPRTPCGVRRRHFAVVFPPMGFQSTHPLRGATNGLEGVDDSFDISIHAPLAGCDSKNVQRKLHFF